MSDAQDIARQVQATQARAQAANLTDMAKRAASLAADRAKAAQKSK